MAASDAAAPAFPLADSELFKESSITTLEGLLKEAGPHAVKAGKALLRLYQIYPARLNRDNVVAGLALALTALPKSDFQLALYLVPAPVRADAAVVALEECERLLQMGRFTAFWEKTKAAELAGPLASAAEFANGIRGFMLEALNRMYQRVELPTLNTYLDLADSSSFATAHGWTLDGASAVAPAIADNTAKPKAAFDEGLKYQEVAGLVATLTK